MSDLISREAVINEINALLKSPYAHSQCGPITKEDAYYIRKEMAGTIIDLCLKSAKTAYNKDKVIEQLKDKAKEDWEGYILDLTEATKIVERGGVE